MGEGSGGQIGAKSWIFQTELWPIYIPVTRRDQCYAFFLPGIALSNNRHNTFSRVKNTKPSGPRPPKFGGGANDTLAPPPLTLGGPLPPCSDTPVIFQTQSLFCIDTLGTTEAPLLLNNDRTA